MSILSHIRYTRIQLNSNTFTQHNPRRRHSYGVYIDRYVFIIILLLSARPCITVGFVNQIIGVVYYVTPGKHNGNGFRSQTGFEILTSSFFEIPKCNFLLLKNGPVTKTHGAAERTKYIEVSPSTPLDSNELYVATVVRINCVQRDCAGTVCTRSGERFKPQISSFRNPYTQMIRVSIVIIYCTRQEPL
jgi:hypothetical protein